MSSSNVDRDQAETVPPLWEAVGRAAAEISRLALAAGPADPAVAEALSALAYLVAGLLEREQPGRRAHALEFQAQVNALALEWPPEAGHIFARLFALDASPDLIATFGPDGRLLAVNGACRSILGYAPHELLGRYGLDLVEPGDGDDPDRSVAAELSGQPVTHAPRRLVRKDGTAVWLEWKVRPAPDQGVVHAVARDSTWRRQAEEAVVASEALNHAVLRSLSAHIAVVDRDGVIVAANDAWINLNRAGSHTSPVHPGVGVSYVDELRQAQGELAEQFRETLAGLQSVLDGTRPEFTREFQYRTPPWSPRPAPS